MFVCVEVLRPSQPNEVMSSAVSLPNHTFTGQALSSKQLTSIVHILSPETDNCPSWISGRERMTVENISWSISMKECCQSRRGSNPRPPGLQSDAHPTEPPRPALMNMKMPTIVVIFIFISRENFMLSSVEHDKCFTTSGNLIHFDYSVKLFCLPSEKGTILKFSF